MRHLIILTLVLCTLTHALEVTDFQGVWGMDPVGTSLANGQPAPQLQGAQLDNARGMFVTFDGQSLKLNIMGIEKQSQCSQIRLEGKVLKMTCQQGNQKDQMELSIKSKQLWMTKPKDSIFMVFDSLSQAQFQDRQNKAIQALKQLTHP